MSLRLSIHSNIRNYDVLIEESPQFIDLLSTYPNSCFIVDENVWNIYAKSLLMGLPENDIIVLPINEDRKNLDTVQEIYDQLVERPAKRNLTMISIGGGILQDITGFAASTIYRGINWIYVPTTLLAQADSCIGSKTSLNYKNYKNLVGTFFPPQKIHIYTPFVQTQLESDYLSGLGEVIKLHLMGGTDSFQWLVEAFPNVRNREVVSLLKSIQQSLNIKLDYMTGDEFDAGRRNLLNYGHDFGHALESTSNFAMPHGQAVIFGILAANAVAQKRGILEEKFEEEIAERLLIPSLVIKPPLEATNSEAMISAMKKDKKRTGNMLALIMMDSNHNLIRVNDLTEEEVDLSVNILKERLSLY